jgi:hypothetical protein
VLGRPTQLVDGESCALDLDGEQFTVAGGGGRLMVRRGADPGAAATVTATADALVALMSRLPGEPRPRGLAVRGDASVVDRALASFAGALRAA